MSGAHRFLFPETVKKLRELGADDIQVIGGGIIPPADFQLLYDAGLKGVFVPGIALDDIVKWIEENWTVARLPRIGILYFDHPAGCEAAEGIKLAAKQGHCEYIGKEVVPLFGAIDTTVEWLRTSGKNPDWIVVLAYGATMTTIARDAFRLEIQKKGIKLAVPPLVIGETAMKAMDDGYMDQNYYRNLNAMLPLLGDKKETFTFDTYGWTEHISRKWGQWYPTPDDLLKQFAACGFHLTGHESKR